MRSPKKEAQAGFVNASLREPFTAKSLALVCHSRRSAGVWGAKQEVRIAFAAPHVKDHSPSVTAPRLAEETARAYFASTPRVNLGGGAVQESRRF